MRLAFHGKIVFAFVIGGAASLYAQSPVEIRLHGHHPGNLQETRDHEVRLKGIVIAPRGLASMYTIDRQGNRGEVSYQLQDGAAGRYSFAAAPFPLRSGVNNVAVVAADAANQAASVGATVLARFDPEPFHEVRTGQWMGHRVNVQIIDGMAVLDGDMILASAADFERAQTQPPAGAANRKNPTRDGLTTGFTSSLWPTVSGVVKVPYVITSGSSNMTSAIASFNATFSGLIQFTPRVAESDYVNINLDASNHSYSCRSTLGRAGGAQTITGSIDCQVSTLLHEMGHAIGLYHEHQRPDYQTFINYYAANIDAPLQPGNFGFVTDNVQAVGLYDYSSIMHYGGFTFAKNNQPVLETIPAGMPIGESTNYSAGDIDQVKRLYAAAPTQVTVTTNPPGLPIAVDGTSYTSPQSFAWVLGSSHTIGAPAGYQTTSPSDGAQYVFGNWNDSGAQSHTVVVTVGNGTRAQPAASPAVTVYVASFQRYNPVTLSTFGSGSIQLSPAPAVIGGANYLLTRSAVTATATPNSGNVFYRWYGNDPFPQGQNPKSYFISSNPYSIQAQFTATANVYTVSSAFTNNTPANPYVYATIDGSTTALPNNYTPAFDSSWTSGSSHTLNLTTPQYPVTTNLGYQFTTWNFGGSPTTAAQSITLPAATTSYTATFKPSYRGYSVVSPSCAAASPNPLVTDQLYDDSSSVPFQVNPIASWFFAGFSGGLSGATNPQTLTVHDQFVVTANLNTVATPLTVTGTSPASLPVGAASQLVTIVGTGFTASSLVFVNGLYSSGRTVNFVDSQHLQVQLGPTDLTTAGGMPIAVQNSANSCSIFVETTFLIRNAAAAASTVTANAGSSPQSAAVNTAFANALAVTVRDGASNPLQGVSVTFTAPASGASGVFSNGTTSMVVTSDGTGVASASFTANAIAGSYSVTAAVSGVGTNATFTLTNSSTAVNGDFDGNGKGDLIWRNTSGTTVIWYMGGTDGSTVASYKQLAGDSSQWRVVAVADLNGDGKLDLLWQNTSGTAVVWYMGGADGSVYQSAKQLSGDTATWKLIAAADMDGNGKADLIWQSTGGTVVVWYMGGSDGSVYQSAKQLAADSAIWKLIAVADMDGNGKPDLIWQNTTGAVVVWYMGGSDGSAFQSGKQLAADSAAWKLVAVGDLNGDGKLDLIWQNTTGTVVVWYMGGSDGSVFQSGKQLAGDSAVWAVIAM